MLARIDANKSELNFTMSSELTSLSERLSCLWTTTQDKILGKQAMLSYTTDTFYGLKQRIKILINFPLCILLAGELATNPGPNPAQSNLKTKAPLKCLLIVTRCLKSQHKQSMQ